MKTLLMVVVAAFLAAACSEKQADTVESSTRLQEQAERVNRIIQAGAITDITRNERGELVTIRTPEKGPSPSVLSMKTCTVWRDISLGSTSLQCNDSGDLVIANDDLQEIERQQALRPVNQWGDPPAK